MGCSTRGEAKKVYTLRVTTSETNRYHIEAGSPWEARELVMSGDYDPFEIVDSSIDDVVVEE